ncbi:MAG: lamin tail domain-containing protein [Acidimicrobiia bacterium]
MALVLGSVLAACAGPVPATTTAEIAPEDSVTTTTRPGAVTTVTTATSTTDLPTTITSGEQAKVVSVTDGDTIRVDHEGGNNEAVRLIGINSPEIGECFATKATVALTSLVGGGDVIMVRDVSDRDQYGRLLRYLYLIDGTFVNEELVRQGFGLSHDYPPDSSQSDVLDVAQSEAESEGLGMWAADACGNADTASGLTITDVVYDAPGNDNDNLNGEWVEIANETTSTATLTGWALKDESASHRYLFPNGLTLSPGATIRIYTGCGSDNATKLYWCNTDSAVWNNSGDTVFLLDPGGNIHDQFSY